MSKKCVMILSLKTALDISCPIADLFPTVSARKGSTFVRIALDNAHHKTTISGGG